MLSARLRAREGFGLVESLVSLGIAATGLLAVAGLMAVGARQMASSRDGGKASMVATTRLERLRMLPHNAASRQIGGSLAANVANYSEIIADPVSGNYTVRWQIAAGPAGTLDVSVRALPANPMGRPSTVRGLLWR